MNNSNKLTIFKIIVIVFSITVTLGAVELVAKTYLRTADNVLKTTCKNYDSTKLVNSISFSQIYYHYPPLEQVHHCALDFDYTYQINDNGLRVSKDASSSARKILAVGDSFTFGFGVKDEEAFPALIKAQNSGMWGNPFNYQIESFKRNVELFKPDVVVWGIYPPHVITMMPKEWSDRCPGDTNYRGTGLSIINTLANKTSIGKYIMKQLHIKKVTAEANKLIVLKDCYQTKEVLLYDTNLLNNRYTSNPKVNKTFATDRDAVYKLIKKYFIEAKQIADSHGTKVFFVIIPSKLNLKLKDGSYSVNYPNSLIDPDLPTQIISAQITESGFDQSSIINLGEYFSQYPDWSKYYFKTDAHWNKLGHQKVADIVKKIIDP